MSARPIGEIVAPIVQRAVALAYFQNRINLQDSPEAKKHLIMLFREVGAIDGDQARLLIEANMLETA